MKKQILILTGLVFILGFNSLRLSAQYNFNYLDSLFAFADRNSASSKISTQQNLIAKWAKVAAMANAINFRNPLSFSATDNLLLPVNFIPAEAFGGPPGSFKQITLGQQYVSNFNFNPQIDLINLQNIARVKSADINKELTDVNNQIIKKSLHEGIAAVYFNCVSLNQQIIICERNVINSDSITNIVKNKYDIGVARLQDYNNAKANALLVKDKLQQLNVGLTQQLNSLKILCDIPSEQKVTIDNLQTFSESAPPVTSNLEYKYMALQQKFLQNEWRVNKFSMMPVLSLVYYQGWQQNSNNKLFDSQASWIQSKYFGLRITVPFPPDATKLSQTYTSRINAGIAGLNATHIQLQNELANKNLESEYEKTLNSYKIAEEISELKKDNYEKSLNQYKVGILPTDILLVAFTEYLNSKLSAVSALGAYNYSKAKLNINNTFK